MRFLIVFLLFYKITQAQGVKKDLFGFATSNTFTYCDINDTSFVNKIISLNPRLLRFPGGAVGNFYHFGKSGYGFDFVEIDQYHAGKMPKRARGLEKSRIKKNHNHDYIDDFITLAQKTNSKVVLVANLFVDNNDILYMINKIEENNLEIVGVELGSELSNRSYFKKGYTIDNYISSANSLSKKIKAKYPHLKIAVVAAPIVNRKGHRHKIWNKKLAELDFYDAIIIHSYAKIISGEDYAGEMVSEDKEGANKTETFSIYKDRAINYLQYYYPDQVKEYSQLFNKPIWVTEWNLQMSKTTGNTFLQALFVANYLLEILSNPDLNDIELTTYHNLGGRAVSIFVNNKDTEEIQGTYYSMLMISSLFRNDVFRVHKDTEGDKFTYTCFNKQGEEILVYLIDWGLKEMILYDKSLKKKGQIKKINIASSNFFDIPDIDGRFKLSKIQ